MLFKYVTFENEKIYPHSAECHCLPVQGTELHHTFKLLKKINIPLHSLLYIIPFKKCAS